MFQGTVLPAFFDLSQPTDPVWSQLESATASISVTAVADDQAVLTAVYGQLTSAGVTVFGYVFSNQGRVPEADIGAEIDSWFAAFPDLSGMFVDVGPPLNVNDPEQQESPDILAYYQFVYNRIKNQQPAGRTAPAPTIILNCGGLRDTDFVENCLDIAVWEQDYTTYQKDSWWQDATAQSGSWWTNAQENLGKQVAHVIHSVPQGDQPAMQNAISLASQRGANFVYVYDGTSADYGRLPTFWNSEVSALAALGGGGDGGTIIVRPQSPTSAWHAAGAADAAAALARPVQQPTSVDASQYIWAGGVAGAVVEVSVGAPPSSLDSTQPAHAWFYANTGPTTMLIADVVVEGQVLGSASVAPGTGFDWHEIVLPQAALPAGQVYLRFTVFDGGDSNVRAAYLQFAVK